MRRRVVIAGAAALLAVLVLGVVTLASRDTTKPAPQLPLQAKPSQQYGDDADLMRRLERKKLTTTTSR